MFIHRLQHLSCYYCFCHYCLITLLSSPSLALSGSSSSISSSSATTTTTTTLQMRMPNTNNPRIAVIGGGAAGLAAARVLSRDAPHCRVTVLEQRSALGGVWKYNNGDENPTSKDDNNNNNNNVILPQSNTKTNPMYRNLRTNLPKELMQYREFPWIQELVVDVSKKDGPEEVPSFMTHQQVLQYLQAYARHFSLNVTYRATVQTVALEPSTRSLLQPAFAKDEHWPQFRVDWTTLDVTSTTGESGNNDGTRDQKQKQKQQQQQQQSQLFDAVCVCNGHYNRPVIPDIPGLADYFTGTTLHSIAYDTPTAATFVGKTVLCIGGRASGADIARELAAVCPAVYLSDTSCTRATTLQSSSSSNSNSKQDDANDKDASQSVVTLVPATVAVLPNGCVQFAHDCDVTPAVDVIIYCTGYDYGFDFFKSTDHDGSDGLNIQAGQRRVQPLVEQLWHARYPHLAFCGLPHSVVPFPLFEIQMEAFCRQIVASCNDNGPNNDNKTTNKSQINDTKTSPLLYLPGLDERLALAEQDAESGGPNKNGRVPEDTHFLGDAQWDYCRRMGEYAGIADDAFLKYIATSEKIYNDAGAARKADGPGSPDTYRSRCYERLDEEESFRVWMLGEKV